MAQHTQTMIPLQVLTDIDNARNPIQLTRDRLERAATENQFMNGKIAAVDVGLLALINALNHIAPCCYEMNGSDNFIFLVVSQIFERSSCAEFPRACTSFTHFENRFTGDSCSLFSPDRDLGVA
jgi:hypothetical protein